MTTKSKQLDAEIASALAKSHPRRLSRADRIARAAAILEYIGHRARVALALARDTEGEAAYMSALAKFNATLPASLWVGGGGKNDSWFVSTAEPIWITDDPEGEDPAAWSQIARDELARILVEYA